MKKGSYVSRSAYQKLAEENKRLKADIKILVTCDAFTDESFGEVFDRWNDHFRKEAETKEIIRIGAEQYLKDHPELKI